MQTPAVALLVCACAAAAAQAQCCLGAQNGTFESKNGCHRVEATSLTGTGPSHHGPYKFRFRFLTRAKDEWIKGVTFDLDWNTREHFYLRVLVSPTGNGCLVDMRGSPTIEFRTRDGHVAASYERSELHLAWEQPTDLHFVELLDPEPVPVPGMSNGLNYVPCGRLFLPFGAPVGPELEKRLLALFAPNRPNEADRSAIRELVQQLEGDPGVRAAAEQQLVAYGEKARRALELARATGSETRQRAAAGLLSAIDARIGAGHAAPARNLSLLAALLTYPSAKVATQASKRLDELLPASIYREEIQNADFAAIAAWIEMHAHEFHWNEGSGSYERR